MNSEWAKMLDAIDEYCDLPGRSLLTIDADVHPRLEIVEMRQGRPHALFRALHVTTLIPGFTPDVELVDAGYPVTTGRAREVFQRVLGIDLTWLPVVVDGQPTDRWLLVIRDVLDCLDLNRSELGPPLPGLSARDIGGPLYGAAFKAVLRRDIVEGRHLFRWARGGGIFVSATLARAVKDAGLTGVWFREVDAV